MARVPADLHASPFAGAPLGTTAVLIRRARYGDDAAREELLRRCIEVLRRFAHGRLPRGARGMLETQDLVQMALVRALEYFDSFTPRRKGFVVESGVYFVRFRVDGWDVARKRLVVTR